VSAFRRLAGCADEKIRLCDLQWVQVSSLEKRNERTDRVSFWMIGNSYVACGVAEKCANSLYSYQDLQNRLFTIFQFVFVARESTQISNIRLSLTWTQPVSSRRRNRSSSPTEMCSKVRSAIFISCGQPDVR